MACMDDDPEKIQRVIEMLVETETQGAVAVKDPDYWLVDQNSLP